MNDQIGINILSFHLEDSEDSQDEDSGLLEEYSASGRDRGSGTGTGKDKGTGTGTGKDKGTGISYLKQFQHYVSTRCFILIYIF